jgi:deoxyribodipyrimidine photolyase-related protein
MASQTFPVGRAFLPKNKKGPLMKTLRLLLGDQLNSQHPWFQHKNPQVTYVLMEVRQETDYVMHHIQKIVAFFGAMRQFAKGLEADGHRVTYIPLNHPDNLHSIPENLSRLIAQEGFEKFEYLLPDEYRLDLQLHQFCQAIGIPWECHDTGHFLTDRQYIARFFQGKKTYLMESFYRNMRKTHGILMEGGQPVGEKWNFDAENRKRYDGKTPVPPVPRFAHASTIRELLEIIRLSGAKTFGEIDPDNFPWPLNRTEALALLSHFVRHLLPHFGTFEDAMETRHPFLFHSRLSFALNTKMLHPMEVAKATEEAWANSQGSISLAQAEGFIRQVIGWREYMRGVYWAHMPGYAELNYFNHQRPLPDWYWTGKTRMCCLQNAIQNSLQHAYAHHIQRLMVTGNFALLAGVHPDALDRWYLGIYIDAIEWVEITNTRGMSQFADGGLVGTKPYVSSANYLDKMSDYCSQCSYDKKARYGKNACPFNSLYWHFYERHKEKLAKNPRIGMMYRTWEKMQEGERKKILQQAETYLATIESL